MAHQSNETHPLDREIATYNRIRGELERHHAAKFVVIKGDELKGTFDTLDNAAQFARDISPEGGFLIRQVGRETGQIPASVLYRHIEPV